MEKSSEHAKLLKIRFLMLNIGRQSADALLTSVF